MTDPEYRTAPPSANQLGCLLIFGLGYTGTAIAAASAAAGWRVIATSRTPEGKRPPSGVELVAFDAAAPAIAVATHILETAAPDAAGDPALARYGTELAAAPHLRWAGMLSTTGVYGDRDGAWVDETTPPAPTGPRGAKRWEAEQQWSAAFARCAVDLFRVAGIYGPGRSPFAEIRSGRSRRVDKPGHRFGRIHRDDIVQAVIAAMVQPRGPGTRVLNLNDDLPVESAEATAEAARLIDRPAPPLVPFEVALREMSPMGASFWAENRRVASRITQAALGITWRYPTYREGLRAILEQERAEQLPE